MRKALALAMSGLAAACLSAAALAEDPVKPELGGGPHRDYREQKGGDGEKPRLGAPEPRVPTQSTPDPASKAPASDASQGGASTGGSRRDEEERKATESKEKAKKRPGYQDEAPSPRG
jgi:hypothetical protein